ncbi:MAG: DUF262 domain-containing protein, partial [Muribaculum sp.]|nr:DUF262 domain-containing protein [Muribaculum sp.]
MGLYNTDLKSTRNLLNAKYANVKLCDWESWGSWYYHYYFQLQPDGYPSGLHFEYRIPKNPNKAWGKGVLELHLEPHSDESKTLFKKIGIRLMHQLAEVSNVDCEGRNGIIPFDSFVLKRDSIETDEDLVNAFDTFYKLVDRHIRGILATVSTVKLDAPYPKQEIEYSPMGDTAEDVSVRIMNLKELMSYNLTLPDYQREYCWEDQNITELWQNLTKIQDGKPFHLGTVILHDYQNSYGIIDGQQRLVTLSIMLFAMGYDGYLPLLNERYESTDAQEHIANCKYIVQGLVSKEKNVSELVRRLVENISFAVLTVNEANLDLAYTFFSNQNSKGVPLSDFDLLKAHHLRFIPNDGQAEHMAIKWNKLTMLPPIFKEKNALYRTLGTHIYRLRRWMRKKESHEIPESHYIQREYQTAVTMADIPPFGERFDFYEKIQGGTHFFVYAETFIHRYLEFLKNPIVQTLQNHLAWGSYLNYADAIETILFAYYLKFGNQYMAEALYCISQIMALHRYNSTRVASDGTGIRSCIKNTELVLMIDQASSPSFFLAEALIKQDKVPQEVAKEDVEPIYSGLDVPEARGVKYGMYQSLYTMWHNILPEITDNTIR